MHKVRHGAGLTSGLVTSGLVTMSVSVAVAVSVTVFSLVVALSELDSQRNAAVAAERSLWLGGSDLGVSVSGEESVR